MVLDRYHEDLPEAMKLLNNYITGNSKNQRFRKTHGEYNTGISFVQDKDKVFGKNKPTTK